MGFPALPINLVFCYTKFQSLVGVYGFSRKAKFAYFDPDEFVSIPSRGLWVFPPLRVDYRPSITCVSIPSRGLWVFPPPVFEAVAVFGFQGSFAGL